MATLLALGGRSVLTEKILFRSKTAVFVRTVIHHWLSAGKSRVGRRRWQSPLQRGALPRIRFRCWPSPQTPEKVDQKNQLPGDGDDGRQGDKPLQWQHRCHILYAGQIGIAPRMPGNAEQMHWHKYRISSGQSNPEMQAAQALIHHAPKHLGKPEVGG